jgi:hypothetical protein
MGGTVGSTEFEAFDMDLSGNFAIGGHTKSTDLATSETSFAIFLDSSLNLKWQTTFSTTFLHICSVAFRADDQNTVLFAF